jgi:hypothetical protein
LLFRDNIEIAAGVMIVLVIVAGLILREWRHEGEYYPAQRVISKLKDAEEDAVEFARLHEKFSSDTQARSMQQADKERIRAFFGNSNVLTS